MLLAAAFCPGPPLLVPELAGGAAAELDGLRQACDLAVAAMLEVAAGRVLVLGGGSRTHRHDADAVGSLAPFGLDLRLGTGHGPADLPLSLGLGRWLLDRAGYAGTVVLQEVSGSATPGECAALGADLLADESASLLVIADGSGYPLQTPVDDDGRGSAYDDRVAAAIGAVDPDALLKLNPVDDAPLWVRGRAAWQVLAGAAGAGGATAALDRDRAGHRAGPGPGPGPAALDGHVLWRGAPYGVGYLVATWLPR